MDERTSKLTIGAATLCLTFSAVLTQVQILRLDTRQKADRQRIETLAGENEILRGMVAGLPKLCDEYGALQPGETCVLTASKPATPKFDDVKPCVQGQDLAPGEACSMFLPQELNLPPVPRKRS